MLKSFNLVAGTFAGLAPWLAVIAVLLLFVVFFGQRMGFFGQRINLPSGSVLVPSETEERTLEAFTLLPRDAIRAIDDPQFITADEAQSRGEMVPGEAVMALNINGEARAYPLNILSRHEIVNDTVGGVPVAVTF
jgi:hypothetical protein